MRYEYDDWNRLVKIFTSYDTGTTPSVSYEYHNVPLISSNADIFESGEITELSDTWYTITNNKVSFDADDKNVIQTVVEIDGLGRAVRTAKTGFVNGTLGWNVSGAVEYDAKGRIVKQGMTEFFEGSISDLLSISASLPSLFTSFEYDEKDRKIKTILPDSSLHQVDFKIEDKNLIAKSTDPLKNITRTFYDERGNIIKLEKYDCDENLLTKLTYAYNSIGEMIQVLDAAENPISAEYDLLGRCIAPALSDYVPIAPVSDETRQHNSNLPGMGGVFNHINGNLYHYAGNNPLYYTDPTGSDIKGMLRGQ